MGKTKTAYKPYTLHDCTACGRRFRRFSRGLLEKHAPKGAGLPEPRTECYACRKPGAVEKAASKAYYA